MKKVLLFFIMAVVFLAAAKAQTVEELQETAAVFMRQGDYGNATLVLNRAAGLAPKNMSIQKSLALAYNYQKLHDKALEAIKKVIDSDEADDQSFQVAGTIYKDLSQPREAEKLYRKGIKKFSTSGPLYNELGELLMAQQDYSAIKQWEKGIEMDPGYSKNYFNAAKFYYLTTDPLWSIIYGEIFINIEPFSTRTPEMKAVLLDGYKKLFASGDFSGTNKDKKNFESSYRQTLAKQNDVATYGITTPILAMIRTRFILDWYGSEAAGKFPMQLFDYQKDLLQTGLFEVYNEWLFGTVENLQAYQNWISNHAAENTAFLNLQKNRIFKIPTGQYYK